VSPAQRLIIHRIAQALRVLSVRGSGEGVRSAAAPSNLPLSLLGGLLDALEPPELVLPGVQLMLTFLRRAMRIPLRMWTAMHAARGQPAPCEAVLQRLFLETKRIEQRAANARSTTSASVPDGIHYVNHSDQNAGSTRGTAKHGSNVQPQSGEGSAMPSPRVQSSA